ncbi:ATP-binding protein [Kordiimonas lacus]|uniref:histidine kinase n=1 Tax=Kordiimonas lacus TaxID=637679 RepID=A0A1G6TY31_9PROT|nr:ATP-binding protein [Kordiimonas lacus]SDD34072.1 CHASE4 domain-containing protein [Kordiimonas lacus]
MNFHRLVAPVFIAVAASIAAFVGVVIVAATLQDEAALEAEAKVIEQDMASIHKSLAVLAEDNAWWDESVDNITIEEDIDWIDTTIGESVNGIQDIHGVLVLRPDASLIYANFVQDLPAPHVLLDAGFQKLIRTFPKPKPREPISRSGFILAEGQLLAFGASLVQNSGINQLDDVVAENGHSAIIFVAQLTAEHLEEMGTANAIHTLSLTNDPGGSNASLPVLDFDGNPIRYLVWKTAAPGSEMVSKMIFPAIVLLIIVVLALGRFMRRANQLFRELEGANKAKSAFLASTSHEIRTPLNAILGFTELISLELYGKVEGEKNKEYLTLIRQSGEHLLSIINDILDISKLEAERFEIYAEKVDPILVVDASSKIIQAQADEKSIEITKECESAELFSDERIMRQVLINLLSNAVKFTRPNGQIMISGHTVEDRYQLVVRDTGIGMSKDEIQKAVSLFGQVQGEYARSHTGTGLGLPLVSRFMELLGGDFAISSVPGEGTTVTLGFPLYIKKS